MSELRLGEALGEGGAGIVYDGTWQGRRVAIKKLPGHFTRAADQEMQLISRLRHDNVVRYYTMEKHNTAVFLVMELITGGTLFDYIQREFQRPNYWIISHGILRDIANGMNYLHGQNIIHGDLKSNNILLRRNNQAVICDFGLSKTLTTAQSHMMKTGSDVQGTTRWLAPELCRPPPERVSHKSDVWAFGCVILEITSGDLPWMNQFDQDNVLFFVLQDDGSRQGQVFAHECAIQKAPTKIRKLLCLCCRWSKMHRPNFSTIMNILNNVSYNDLKNITQLNNLKLAPCVQALSQMSIHLWQEECEQRAQEEREQKEHRDRLEEDRRRRYEQNRRNEEWRAEQRRRQRQQEQEWKSNHYYCPNCSRNVVSHENSSDSNDGVERRMTIPVMSGVIMMVPFEREGGGGMNTFNGSGKPQPLMSTELPSGAHYTGQLYASRGRGRGRGNGRPPSHGSRRGTYYMTRGGNNAMFNFIVFIFFLIFRSVIFFCYCTQVFDFEKKNSR